MKILTFYAVLFIALSRDVHSIKVNSDTSKTNELNPHALGTITTLNSKYGATSYADSVRGGIANVKSRQYNLQQPHSQLQNQVYVQQNGNGMKGGVEEQEFYYPNQLKYPQYYPQHQYHAYATDKTFGVGGGGGGGEDEGIFGGLTSMFSGILDTMFGMSGHEEMPTGNLMSSHGYGVGGDGMGWSMGGGGGGADGLGGIGGGIGGFIKGKKAGWLARGAVGLLLSPVILPIIILWIALIVLIIWFIPIPVIDVNGNNDNFKRRSFPSQLYSPVAHSMELAKSVLESGECVERLTCEIVSRLSKNYVHQQDWLQRKMDSFTSNKWIHRVSRSFKSTRNGLDCSRYSCTIPSKKSPSQKTSLEKDKTKQHIK